MDYSFAFAQLKNVCKRSSINLGKDWDH